VQSTSGLSKEVMNLGNKYSKNNLTCYDISYSQRLRSIFIHQQGRILGLDEGESQSAEWLLAEVLQKSMNIPTIA